MTFVRRRNPQEIRGYGALPEGGYLTGPAAEQNPPPSAGTLARDTDIADGVVHA